MKFTLENIKNLSNQHKQRLQEAKEKREADFESLDASARKREKINKRLQNMIDGTDNLIKMAKG